MTAAPPARDFASDIAVRPGGDGRWLADLSPRWDVARGPNGGYVAAVVLQAMLAQLDDAERAPRSLTLHYLRPPSIGPCEITVTVQRSGRGMSTLTARLSQDAKVTILAIGAFAADYPGAATYAVAAPAVGPPGELVAVPEQPGLPEVVRRTVVGAAPGIDAGGGDGDQAPLVTGGWLRLAEPHTVDPAALAFYVDAWLPAPLVLLGTQLFAPTVDLTIHFRAPLPHPGMAPEDPVLVRFTSRTASGGFFEEDGEVWAPDGTLLAQSRQLALLLAPPPA